MGDCTKAYSVEVIEFGFRINFSITEKKIYFLVNFLGRKGGGGERGWVGGTDSRLVFFRNRKSLSSKRV